MPPKTQNRSSSAPKGGRRAKQDGAHAPGAGIPCSFPGCAESGEYKAPLSPQDVRNYRWFCLTHVREYNANWDYFADMGAEEIEHFMKDAMYGHRPTWQINSQKFSTEKLEDALTRMLHGEQVKRRKTIPEQIVSDKERKALAVLNLEPGATLAEIKKRYKELVKQHHPDVNKGDKKAEERFKRITDAYQQLRKQQGS